MFPFLIRSLNFPFTALSRWEVRCYINNVRTYIGIYDTKEEGIAALREAGADNFNEEEVNAANELECHQDQKEVKDDDTTNTGNDTDADTTDGSIEPETPRNKYFPIILYHMINDSSNHTPEVSSHLIYAMVLNYFVNLSFDTISSHLNRF